MTTFQTDLPRSVILLIGPPRSGTTLIANAFMAHSSVAGVLEPYQRWRHEGLEEAHLPEFLAAHKLHATSDTPNLVVKETTTRLRNVELSLNLLGSAASCGLYRGLVLILRCPLTAYLSQVEASGKYWAEKKMTEENQASLSQWAVSMRRSLRLLSFHARSQHFRIVGYERFCSDPAAELARLMTLIPEPLEQKQLAFGVADKIQGRGDPKGSDAGECRILR